MRKTKITAVCGMMTALSVVLMFITTFVPVAVYILPIATGLIVGFICEATDVKWALGVFFSTALLSFVLLTDKEAAFTYAVFFGYYPLIKPHIEKLQKVVSWLVKIVLFNAAAVSIGFAGVYILGASGDEYNDFGKLTIPILLLLANTAFVLYDIALSKYASLIKYFALKLQKFLNKR